MKLYEIYCRKYDGGSEMPWCWVLVKANTKTEALEKLRAHAKNHPNDYFIDENPTIVKASIIK